MQKQSFFMRPAFYIVMAVYIVLAFLTLAMGNQIATFMLTEDHYFENVGAISLFIASGLSLWAFVLARRLRGPESMSVIKQLVYLGLAVVFFFLAAEEISWGQRIFGIATPQELVKYNDQEELNVHNLYVLEQSSFFSADRLFDMLWAVFAVAIPVASLFGDRFRSFATRYVPVVYWGIGTLFVFNYLLAKLAKAALSASYSYGMVVPFTQAVQEVKESNYELLFAFVGLYLLLDLRNLHDRARKNM